MRFVVMMLLAAVVLQTGAAGQDTKLPGVWTIDKTKGTASERSFDLVLTVEVNGDVITARIDGTLPGADHHNFIVDGKAHSFPWGDTVPPGSRQSTVNWLRDADGFAGTEGGAMIRWTISPDGQTLTIDTVWSNGRHDVYVYNRQQ